MRLGGVLATALGAAALLSILIASGSAPRTALAQDASGGDCLTAELPPIDAPAHRLRFGITPLTAGSAGVSQFEPKPEDPAAALAALRALRPQRQGARAEAQPDVLVRRCSGHPPVCSDRRSICEGGLRLRAPGPLPPAGGTGGRHASVEAVRAPGGAHSRQATERRRALDHQRGELRRLPEHLRRELCRSARGDRQGGSGR